MLLLVVILVSLQAELGSADADTGQTALRFGEGKNSYVSYNPDMQAFANAFTLCSWVRERRSGNSPMWFAYSDKVYSHGNGKYYILGAQLNLQSKFSSTITPCEWYHVCLSWSSQGNRAHVYWNGSLVGEAATRSGTTVPAGGALILGNSWRPNDREYFGGMMTDFNMYSRVLTAEEIRDIAELGYCPGTEELFDDSRDLKWEDILLQLRTQTRDVKEVDMADSDACKLKKATEQLQKTQKQLDDIAQCLDNKIDLEKSVTDEAAKKVIDEFKTCRTDDESDDQV